MSDRRVIAVIPAAGRARRMGRLKQLLPFGTSTMLETVIQTAIASKVDATIVVVNDAVRSAAESHRGPRCRIVENPDPDSDMLASILIASEAAMRDFGVGPSDGLMVLPADQPAIRVEAVDRVAATFRGRAPPHEIVIARYGSRRGHPAIYALGLVNSLASTSQQVGLNFLAHQQAGKVKEVELDGLAPHDVNYPADYEEATRDCRRRC